MRLGFEPGASCKHAVPAYVSPAATRRSRLQCRPPGGPAYGRGPAAATALDGVDVAFSRGVSQAI